MSKTLILKVDELDNLLSKLQSNIETYENYIRQIKNRCFLLCVANASGTIGNIIFPEG